jgi:formyltetrahydrofolate-dependent phosphoribosylglycinamide formyltransferase
VPTRIAVFASGSGTNLEAILNYFSRPIPALAARVVLVASHRAGAGALERAAARHVPSAALRDPSDDDEIRQLLGAYAVDAVALAGYLRLMPSSITHAFAGRILNVHPALLPAFGGHGMFGARVHAAVLASGARTTGATIHFVTDDYDRGPIIAQCHVPVDAADTPDTISARVLSVEHIVYPRVLHALALGHVRLCADGTVRGGFRDRAEDSVPVDASSRTLSDPHLLEARIEAALGLPAIT